MTWLPLDAHITAAVARCADRKLGQCDRESDWNKHKEGILLSGTQRRERRVQERAEWMRRSQHSSCSPSARSLHCVIARCVG